MPLLPDEEGPRPYPGDHLSTYHLQKDYLARLEQDPTLLVREPQPLRPDDCITLSANVYCFPGQDCTPPPTETVCGVADVTNTPTPVPAGNLTLPLVVGLTALALLLRKRHPLVRIAAALALLLSVAAPSYAVYRHVDDRTGKPVYARCDLVYNKIQTDVNNRNGWGDRWTEVDSALWDLRGNLEYWYGTALPFRDNGRTTFSYPPANSTSLAWLECTPICQGAGRPYVDVSWPVLAYTTQNHARNSLRTGDAVIYINPDNVQRAADYVAPNAYRTVPCDFWTMWRHVFLHELGHVQGLGHFSIHDFGWTEFYTPMNYATNALVTADEMITFSPLEFQQIANDLASCPARIRG